MEALNNVILGFTGLLLATLVGLTIWSLKIIMDVRAGCGGCTEHIKNIDQRQGRLEIRQDTLEANHSELALNVGNIKQRVETLEGNMPP
jgi:hypothetical protein